MAAGLGILLYRPWHEKKSNRLASLDTSLASFPLRDVTIVLVLFIMLAGLSIFNPLFWQLEKVFFRIGFLVFGNGFTMLPLIQQEVVNVHRWLNLDQFLVGIALGQITPGPIVITATFVGYKVAGFLGALAATAGIFAPCFILVILVMPVYKKFKENRWVKVIFSSVLASFTGLMVSILLDIGRHGLIDPVTVVLALAALIMLRFTRLDVLWVVLGGTGIYLLIEKI